MFKFLHLGVLAVVLLGIGAGGGAWPTATDAARRGIYTTTTTTTTLAQVPPRSCGDVTGDGSVQAADALAVLSAAVGSGGACSALVCDVVGGANGVNTTDALAVLQVAVRLNVSLRCPTVARLWMEELLDAIRQDTPRPTVHARNLFHLSVALWDIWVAYDADGPAVAYLTEQTVADGGDVAEARNAAMSFAAYRVLAHRFAESPGSLTLLASFNAVMADLGYDHRFKSVDGSSPAALGNRVAAAVIAAGAVDGANEAADYADTIGYEPINNPLIVKLRGTTMHDANRWQPLSLDFFVTQNGIPLPIQVQEFIGSHWDTVTPFALVRESPDVPYVDPGLPPQLGGDEDAVFKASVTEVIRYSSWVDPDDGVMIDISPASRGGNPLGTNNGSGWPMNPATGQSYVANMVKRGDWGRILAEFWADGPDSETPPGHWVTLANYVGDHPLVQKRIGGDGPVLEDLEWDVKLYLAMSGAMHDAAVAAWGNKAIYDYVRPISMIRHMAGLGQSSKVSLPSFHPNGLSLENDLVELVTAESSAPGQRHEHLAEEIDAIAIRAWQGNPEDAETEHSGVGWILAEEWVPYQRETFVTPAFASYVSGHSTFSRAGAEVLTRFTGDSFFPGGIGEFLAPAHDFLEFESGPTQDILLQWATYQDAADEAGVSRLWGGIHVRADDFDGRIMGQRIGQDAYDLAESYWNGSAAAPIP